MADLPFGTYTYRRCQIEAMPVRTWWQRFRQFCARWALENGYE